MQLDRKSSSLSQDPEALAADFLGREFSTLAASNRSIDRMVVVAIDGDVSVDVEIDFDPLAPVRRQRVGVTCSLQHLMAVAVHLR